MENSPSKKRKDEEDPFRLSSIHHAAKKSLSSGVGSKSEACLKIFSQCEAKLVDGASSTYHNFQGELQDLSTDSDNEMNKREDCVSQMDLTNDLLHIVLSFLDQKSLCHAALICHQWNYVSNHDEFWTCLDFEKYKNVSADQAIRLCCKHPSATKLNLNNHLYDEDTVHEAILALPGLEELTLSGDLFKDDFSTVVLNKCRTLKFLVLSDAYSSEEIEINHDKLCHLELRRCDVLLIKISCPELYYLSVVDSEMQTTDLNCPQIHQLDLLFCSQLPNAVIFGAVRSFPTLKELKISHCKHVTNAMLREISSVCINLSSLDISYCRKISLKGVWFPRLTKLTLKYCERIKNSTTMMLSNCFRLESIEFDNCRFLRSVILDLPHLRNISISNCFKFTSLNLTCPSLENISVHRCSHLTCVDITSYSLKKLVLMDQQCLTKFISLTSTASKVPSQFIGCPRIQTLTLQNCEIISDFSWQFFVRFEVIY